MSALYCFIRRDDKFMCSSIGNESQPPSPFIPQSLSPFNLCTEENNLLSRLPISIDTYICSVCPGDIDIANHNDRNRLTDIEVLRCSAMPMSSELIVDTTGAGDAFIGGFLAGIVDGLSHEVISVRFRVHLLLIISH